MRRQYIVQFRLFLQVGLVDGIPLSSTCRPTVYRYLAYAQRRAVKHSMSWFHV